MINTVEKIYDDLTNQLICYKVTYSDSTFSYVPLDTANKDYQAIQDWIAAGNSVIDPNAE